MPCTPCPNGGVCGGRNDVAALEGEGERGGEGEGEGEVEWEGEGEGERTVAVVMTEVFLLLARSV